MSSLSRLNASSSRRSAPRVMSGHMSRSTASRSRSGSTASPPSARISRPRAWNVLTRTAPAERPSGSSAASTRDAISSAARLLNVTAVMRAGSAPRRHEPRDPGDEGRRLATPRGGDAQHRAGWRGGSRPLIGRKAGESFGDGGWQHTPRMSGGSSLALMTPVV